MLAAFLRARGTPSYIVALRCIGRQTRYSTAPIRSTLSQFAKFVLKWPGTAGLVRPTPPAAHAAAAHGTWSVNRMDCRWRRRNSVAVIQSNRHRESTLREIIDGFHNSFTALVERRLRAVAPDTLTNFELVPLQGRAYSYSL